MHALVDTCKLAGVYTHKNRPISEASSREEEAALVSLNNWPENNLDLSPVQGFNTPAAGFWRTELEDVEWVKAGGEKRRRSSLHS